MPQVREYVSPVDTIRPAEAGAEALARSGRTIGGLAIEGANAVGQGVQRVAMPVADAAVRYQEQSEISTGAAVAALQFHNQVVGLKNHMNTADVNDHEAGPNYIQQNFEPFAEKFAQGFTTEKGKAFAQQTIDNMRTHLYGVSAADTITRQTDAAHQNAGTTLNSLSTAVYNDPTAFNAALKQWDASVEAFANATGDPVAGGKIREGMTSGGHLQLAVSSAMSEIKANPDAALANISGGKYDQYIDGTTKAKLVQEATRAKEHAGNQAKADDAVTRRNQAIDADRTAGNLIGSLTDANGLPSPPKDFYQQVQDAKMNNPDLARHEPALMSAFQRATREASSGKYMQSDPVTLEQLRSRAFLPPTDPNALTEADVLGQMGSGGKLSTQDGKLLMADVRASTNDPVYRQRVQMFNQWIGSQKSSISKTDVTRGLYDNLGDQRYEQVYQQAKQEYLDGIKNGKSPKDLLGTGPGSLSYLISQGRPSAEDVAAAAPTGLIPPPNFHKPGLIEPPPTPAGPARVAPPPLTDPSLPMGSLPMGSLPGKESEGWPPALPGESQREWTKRKVNLILSGQKAPQSASPQEGSR